MIGRAAQGRPWIFREIAHFLETGTLLAPPLVSEVRRWLTEHLGMIRVLSIRTVLQLASMVKTDEDWKDMAEVTMLGRRS